MLSISDIFRNSESEHDLTFFRPEEMERDGRTIVRKECSSLPNMLG
jgi:hypothetical protein